MTRREPRRCMAPVCDGTTLCGALATEEREVEGLVVDLCPEHAAELDREKIARPE